jgi:hypothetical protein
VSRKSETAFVTFEHVLARPSQVRSRAIVERMIELARITHPEVLIYSEIAEQICAEETAKGRSTFVAASLVPQILRREAPELLVERRRAREARLQTARENRRFDGRKRDLDRHERARIFAKARVFIVDALGREVPAYGLAEIGRRFGPPSMTLRGGELSRHTVRRVLLSMPGGRELLRARLEALRASARPARSR